MSAMVVLRLEGQDRFLLVNPDAGTVQQLEADELPQAAAADPGAPKVRGIAEAYALPAAPAITSRKFYQAA